MANLFTDSYIIKSITREARRVKSNIEKIAIQIQKEIDRAAKGGRDDTIVRTGDFCLTPGERETITFDLEAAGYRVKWKHCDSWEDERVHIWWEEENV